MKNIYHEGKLINKAGVDRVVLSHVELKKINWPVFKKAITASSDIIYDAFRSANRTYYVTEGGDRLHYMTITDPEVGHLNFGANPKKYGIIEFSPANKNNGINIVNFDGKELMEYLAHIKVILSDRYGLEVSFTNCTLKEVELNVTFALNHPYDDYYRALSVLFSDMPYLKKQCEYTGKENKEKQLQSCSAFNKQLSVTPYIYQGEEIGMTNPHYTSIEQYADVESRNYYEILLNEGKTKEEALEILAARSRDNSRTPMQWTDERYCGFSDTKPWIPVSDNFEKINVKKQKQDRDSILEFYKKLIMLRKEKEVIARGNIEFMEVENAGVLAYTRCLDKQKLLVCCNFRDVESQMEFTQEWKSGRKILGNYEENHKNNYKVLTLRPYEIIVLEKGEE